MENNKHLLLAAVIISVTVSSIFGGAMGFWAGAASEKGFDLTDWFGRNILGDEETAGTRDGKTPSAEGGKIVSISEESAVISAVEKVSPAVVSIIVTKDLPVIERYYSDPFGGNDFFRRFFGDQFDDFFGVPQYRQRGTEKQEVGGGTGFLVSADGYIITNRHVVLDEDAEYTVLLNDESRHEAKVLARDPMNDIAIVKIDPAAAAGRAGGIFPAAELGDSSGLKVGQTVIAIGNALGEFRNTVSTGVISGLARSVVAGGGGIGSEQLIGVIQTDASINPGNSGGPLLNLAGQVIGINTAMAAGAENIGFAIPVNEIRSVYESVKEHGRIIRPWLGVRYVMINDSIKESNRLDADYGALIVRGENQTDLAVVPGSPADKAGLAENDIILELDGKKIDADNPLARAISLVKPGSEITLKVLHRGEEKEVKVMLEEMKG